MRHSMSDASAGSEKSASPSIGETSDQEYIAELGFDQFNLSPSIRRAVTERGYLHPTPVQARVFQPMLEGRDLIVRSKTGTGKTAAFGLPLLELATAGSGEVEALVLCPTRELALQVATEISDLGKYKGVSVAAIYGGASMKAQEEALEKGATIVVGTPGRIYDHIRRGNLRLDRCKRAVLDEADEMLSQGFFEEVTRILDHLPELRQILLFSATVPPDIQNLIARYTRNPETFLLSGDVLTVEHIMHIRYDVSDAYPKPRNLIYILEMEEPENAIVFCNTRDDTGLVTAVLNRNGFDAELLNGDLLQKERERVMAKVKRGEVALMVATDIAARGIDISDLAYVINYSLPEDPAVYLHRVGRTGRIGKKGIAINLVSGRELNTLSALENRYGINFERRAMPTPEQALSLWTERHVREIREGASGSVYDGLLALAGQIKHRSDADDLIAFLLKYFFAHHRMDRIQSTHLPTQPSDKRSTEGRSSAAAPEREKPQRDRRKRNRPSERAGTADAASGRPSQHKARPETVRFWMNVGAADGFDDAGLKAALESLGAPTVNLARIDIRPTYSYLVVPEESATSFEGLAGKTLGGKALKLERAKRR